MSSDTRRGLTGMEATMALARLALTRALRGKALWVAVATIAFPAMIAMVRSNMKHDPTEVWESVFVIALLALPVVPSVLVGPSLADEIDDKTSAYLWSRSLPRWTIVIGKLLALAPVAGLIMATGLAASWGMMGATSAVPSDVAVRGIAALAVAGVVGSILVGALALLVPRQAIAIAVIYLLIDAVIGSLPFKLAHVSLLFGARAIAGFHQAGVAGGLITMVAISAVAMFIALRRIATIET
jgi:ABC-type transport system involved in multi-copper enzyme maturation permease subunit